MSSYSATRYLPYTAKQLFTLAADVAEYPTFVPLCQSAEIWDWKRNSDGVEIFDAALVIAYEKLSIREEFISHVRADPGDFSVTSVADQGAVKHLTSRWIFSNAPKHGGCTVAYEVDFQMRSMALHFVMNAAFGKVVNKVLNAFEERAHDLYSKN
jgi:coenzyme Q-binding protein COQ10